jgi:TetR/AcrR family transcriptional repressor of nem operon
MTRGYNGFSYRDLTALVGVKTSSIHYYFPAKEDLVLEAVTLYSHEVAVALQGVPDTWPADQKLDAFAQGFGQALGNGEQICLCGMLAADIASLPEEIRAVVQQFFKSNEAWLSRVLAEGREQGVLAFHGGPDSAARALFAAFQGSVLASRLFHSDARLHEVTAALKTNG